ncbi:MAG: rhomboid family protein [Bacteroidetes bacterium]|nr:rhomboid family protein [Bacteroidota bacterium]
MTVLIILLAVILLLWFGIKKYWAKPQKLGQAYTIDDEYNSKKVEIQNEIDHILSKMGKKGIDDLSEKDKRRLDELSKQLK